MKSKLLLINYTEWSNNEFYGELENEAAKVLAIYLSNGIFAHFGHALCVDVVFKWVLNMNKVLACLGQEHLVSI